MAGERETVTEQTGQVEVVAPASVETGAGVHAASARSRRRRAVNPRIVVAGGIILVMTILAIVLFAGLYALLRWSERKPSPAA